MFQHTPLKWQCSVFESTGAFTGFIKRRKKKENEHFIWCINKDERYIFIGLVTKTPLLTHSCENITLWEMENFILVEQRPIFFEKCIMIHISVRGKITITYYWLTKSAILTICRASWITWSLVEPFRLSNCLSILWRGRDRREKVKRKLALDEFPSSHTYIYRYIFWENW